MSLAVATTRRVILGRAPAAPGGIAALAFSARRTARGLGFASWIDVSRAPDSVSRYVRVVIRADRFPLNIRVSDHEIAKSTCDFELISPDGRSGGEWLSAWLHAVARGEIEL